MSLHNERGRWHTATDEEITQPFLMTVVGGSNHWLFVSSSGALTAGRTNAQAAIFPYETVDRLHRNAGRVGPVTAIRINGTTLWRPFVSERSHEVSRSVSKRTLGDGVRFTEVHKPTGLTFQYEWALSETFGFIRRCSLSLAAGSSPVTIEMIDGFRSVQPDGVDYRTQQSASVLVDAYKRSELVGDIGVYSLTSRIVDRPEPAEALRCTVAYHHGLPQGDVFISDHAVDAFCAENPIPAEDVLLGKPAGYFVRSSFGLSSGQSQAWLTGTDIGWSAAQVVELRYQMASADFLSSVQSDIDRNRSELVRLVARADGLQTSANAVHDDRHATNVMFNCMRGGVIASDALLRSDVEKFIEGRNAPLLEATRAQLASLGEAFSRDALLKLAEDIDDPDFTRLATEYMPLTFSRRHGDPSRPWNTFNIHIRHADGSPRYYFEGNWRDVFQNWEAMLLSFPQYSEAAWTTFFNASTPDGHNPYRIMREGVDWERPDPDDPWAHIGYWGDHQIIYSLKLLEHHEAHEPGDLATKLNQPLYVFADVPYRIAPYEEILADPHDTISFDRDHDRVIDRRREQKGGDGNLLHDGDEIVRATLAEKLLISLLAKVANLVVDGGIWMNTQRPEWNDANNALVGNGLSMVTLAYMTRHVRFLSRLFAQDQELSIHEPVATWLMHTNDALSAKLNLDTSAGRRSLLDMLGLAGETYRKVVYHDGMGSASTVPSSLVRDCLSKVDAVLERSLRASQRDDGTFEAYNLLDTRTGGADVHHLPLMLEGQVAAMSAKVLTADETLKMAKSLFDSDLYRADQNTFVLYPTKDLPGFLDRGIIPSDIVGSNPLLSALADSDLSLVERDRDGVCRFDGAFTSGKDFAAALDQLEEDGPTALADLSRAHRGSALDAYEQVFNHRAFTGRSGTMYGYEGIGSIYWHMVSKLNLAMLECTLDAHDAGIDRQTVVEMAEYYYKMRGGLGDAKTFSEYGAFPIDAYSHTPMDGKARQPGMTGQVKEDILTRRGELGIRVVDGCLRLEPFILRKSEFVEEATTWYGLAADGTEQSIALEPGQLAFTVCQVPVVYEITNQAEISVAVTMTDGAETNVGSALTKALSRSIFDRDLSVARIVVGVPAQRLI